MASLKINSQASPAPINQPKVSRVTYQQALAWILATAISAMIGWVIGPYLAYAKNEFLNVLIYLSFIGLCIGVGQWLVLRRIIRYSVWWPLVTILGWTSAVPILGVIAHLTRVSVDYIVVFALVCIWVSAIQWLGIREYFRTALWWIVLSGAGGALGWALNDLLIQTFLANASSGNLIILNLGHGLCLGLGLGIFTALGLLYLRRRIPGEETNPLPDEENPQAPAS
jgi:hypothetical protein